VARIGSKRTSLQDMFLFYYSDDLKSTFTRRRDERRRKGIYSVATPPWFSTGRSSTGSLTGSSTGSCSGFGLVSFVDMYQINAKTEETMIANARQISRSLYERRINISAMVTPRKPMRSKKQEARKANERTNSQVAYNMPGNTAPKSPTTAMRAMMCVAYVFEKLCKTSGMR
jgi:hypothetical protein